MRKLPVVVFIVDDVAADATKYAEMLQRSMDNAARTFFVDDDLRFDIRVIPIFPGPTELANQFESRFERILCLQDENHRDDSCRLQAILFDLAFGLSAEQGSEPTSGERLAALARRWRPSVTRYGLTSLPLSSMDRAPIALLKTPFKKEQLHSDASASPVSREILNDLQKRFATPTWDGLLDFSKLSKVPMHAMAAAEARQAELTLVVDPFLQLLGSTYYQIEATSTKHPLDSLFAPKGAILKTQEMVAASFGAQSAMLVTNGTSAANKIVYSALVREGDYVLIDECCHISHHMAIAITGAKVVYIAPLATEMPGVPGQVSVEAIQLQLRMILSKHPDRVLPKVIAITNATFDGFIIRPADIFQGVLKVLDEFGASHRLSEITFLFDEAWFSFGYFHPSYVQYSAMGAAQDLKSKSSEPFWGQSLNVVATQSLHKTGFALRQASIILKSIGSTLEEGCNGEMQRRFKSSFKLYTTTSPSMPILASIDWARRQLDLEGCFLVEASHEAVKQFCRNFSDLESSESPLFVASPTFLEIMEGKDCGKDRTKMTLRARSVSGRELRDLLWSLNHVKIQVNKFATDSVLLMFMPGFTDRSSALLRTAFDELLAVIPAKRAVRARSAAVPPSLTAGHFVGDDGQITSYPDALVVRDGLRIRRCVFDSPVGSPTLIRLDKDLEKKVVEGNSYVSLDYVTPYPPGFPILIPSQVITADIVRYLIALTHGEIHGLQEVGADRCMSVIALGKPMTGKS